jgi:urease accessory protein
MAARGHCRPAITMAITRTTAMTTITAILIHMSQRMISGTANAKPASFVALFPLAETGPDVVDNGAQRGRNASPLTTDSDDATAKPSDRAAHTEASPDAATPTAPAPATQAFDARLQAWLSPAFPVGSFAYSHGLELAAEKRWITDRLTLTDWLRDLVGHGAVRNDMILLAEAWRCAADGRWAELSDANELALALQPSAERQLEAVSQGNAFLGTIATAWPREGLSDVSSAVGRDVAYGIAVGAVAAVHRLPLEAVLSAYAVAVVGGLASAAIRLSVIGQTDGQRIIAALLPDIEVCVIAAARATIADIGGAAYRSDIASLLHETQYTRLFRS